MGQVRCWAIAPIALVATFSGQRTLSLSVSNSGGVANSSSTLFSAEFPQNLTDANPADLAVLAQASPKPPPSPQSSPTQIPTLEPRPSPDTGSSKVILEQNGELT